MNGIDLRVATHDEAINVLRQTPQKVRLSVYRDEAQYKEEDVWDVLFLELQKKGGQSLGLSIVGKRYTPPPHTSQTPPLPNTPVKPQQEARAFGIKTSNTMSQTPVVCAKWPLGPPQW